VELDPRVRHGFKFYGKKLDCACFKPAHGLNPDILAKYGQNRLVVTRQIHFALAMKSKVEGLMIDRMDQNQEIVTRYLNDPQFQDVAFRLLVRRIYDEIRAQEKAEAGR